jgi:hypothetical protein
LGRYLETLCIPDIRMPFPRNRHAEQDLAHQATRTWALTHAVMPPDLVSAFLDDLHYTDLIGGYYVGAKGCPVMILGWFRAGQAVVARLRMRATPAVACSTP